MLGGRGDTLKSVANRYVEFSLLPQKAELTRTSYGFRKVYNSLDILAWNHAYAYLYGEPQAMLIIVQNIPVLRSHCTGKGSARKHRRGHPGPSLIPPQQTHKDLSKVKFHAILVFHDPRNWGLDIQVMCDILHGAGFLAEPTSDHSANDVEIIFCNPDMLWKNEWEGPRLGQGGFRKAWEGVWSVSRIALFRRF